MIIVDSKSVMSVVKGPLCCWSSKVKQKESFWNEITQEASREVDRQDDTQREQAHYSHQKDDVTLKCQVRNCINAALTTDLFIPAESKEKPNERNSKYTSNVYDLQYSLCVRGLFF